MKDAKSKITAEHKPLWVRWSAEMNGKLKAKLDEIDLDTYGKAHLYNLSAAACVAIGIAKNLAEFVEIAKGAELNLSAKYLKLWLDSDAARYLIAHDGNRRMLSDSEMSAVIDTTFSVTYRKKDGTICQRNR